ncbi:uncharacterized protein LOC106641749 [Copidosoma floridanum]|uniref:uncharacterized protein LOC106641749 n=1 Tax=Copidosoma floridanum TaxID=29053 RepID=UPI000C6FC77B|nr:uncharacterized protein LOC106641749 [Copidosoma floridanum]
MASGFPSAHRRKLGPAPIASFEDLSDENGGEPVSRMPGILEVATPAGSLKTPSTPRIDISRASSSSHHEEDSNSRESTPEKELLAGNGPPEGCKLQLGYKEDAADLRSSTEELDLHDPVHEQDLRRESKKPKRRAHRDLHDGTQSEYGVSIRLQQSERERKDSNCSEIILLNISGRTSRLSSVGSQGSGVSAGGLSAVSATSSRSPSPHKCLLETSFCGSVSALDATLIESSKLETDDLARVLLEREEDSTRALIPESVRVPIVGGNIKPDPLDMPRRRGREERKEAFKREVEITKRVLKRVNIEVPVIKLPKDGEEGSTPKFGDVQKPATLDLNERRKRSPSSSASSRPGSAAAAAGGSGLDTTPKLQRHQKIRDLEGSRTPSPSSVSRKSSFASLFKGRGDAASIQSQESPTTTCSRRTSLASKLKDTAESLRSRSKSRERPGSGEKSPGGRRSGSGGMFSSTLSLFRKRERKKSGCDISLTDQLDAEAHAALDSIGHADYSYQMHQTGQKEDVIFISLYGENDEFRNQPEEPESESLAVTPPPQLESPGKGREDSFDASSPMQTSVNIVCTDATIEHHRRTRRSERRREGVRISSSSGDSTKMPESLSRDSHICKSESRDSRIAPTDRRDSAVVGQSSTETHEEIAARGEHRLSTSSSRDSIGRRPEVPKPKRKSRSSRPLSAPTEPPPLPPTQQPKTVGMNGKVSSRPPSMALATTVTTVTTTTTSTGVVATGVDLGVPDAGLAKAPSVVSDLDRNNSSESERDSEIDFIRNKAKKGVEELPDERKGLCYEESFEEDLPYVPTTLPMEKSVAIPILPIKQRLHEGMRTTSIDRPRSTTPINPQLLDEYIQHAPEGQQRQQRRLQSKMRISLPREDSFKLKSPHRPSTHNTFTEFAGRVPASKSGNQTMSPSPPPPLPPRAPTTVLTHPRHMQQARPTNWINFEEIPEKRKAPKRIQTIPRLEDDSKHYSYVQPEECWCECHEESRRASSRNHHHHHHHHHHPPGTSSSSSPCPVQGSRRADLPAAEDNGSSGSGGACNGAGAVSNTNGDRSSIVSDNSSLEGSLSADYTGTPSGQHHLTVTTGSNEGTRPFAMDLDVSSNRSSIISQEETEDERT